MLIDFIKDLESQLIAKKLTLSQIEISFDSAFCVQKVIQAVDDACICESSPKQVTTHKFEFEGQKLTPKELIEKVKNGHWKYLAPGRLYQRLFVHHHNYGDVVLIGKKENPCKMAKLFMMPCCVINVFIPQLELIHVILQRWNIEMQFYVL
jgi:hypothetical protein